MSPFEPSSVLLSLLAFTLLAFAALRLKLQVATSQQLSRRTTAHFPTFLAAASSNPDPTHPGGLDGFMDSSDKPWWMRAGLGNRPPAPPETGRHAQVRWWERARALVGLALVVLSLAVFLLGSLGALFLIASYLLEQLV